MSNFEVGERVERPEKREFEYRVGVVEGLTEDCAVIRGDDDQKYFTAIKVNHSFWQAV
jgi:hypothetical protein